MAKKKYKDKYDKLANAPIKQLISSLAIPTILSMLQHFTIRLTAFL